MALKISLARCLAAFFSITTAANVFAQSEERVSIATDGSQANDYSAYSSMSSDGRYVVFTSEARNLVPEVTTGQQIYLRDRLSGTTELISIDENGAAGDGDSRHARVSDNGRYVVFDSYALLAPEAFSRYTSQIYLRDRLENKTHLISKTVDGNPASVRGWGGCSGPNISADGRYIVYGCSAANLVSGDTNDLIDVFVYDRIAQTTQRVSISSEGTPGNDHSSSFAQISADGRYIVFYSRATNLVADDTNGTSDVFVHDRVTETTKLISKSSSGIQGNGESSSFEGDITPDGKFITFTSDATNLVEGDTNNNRDVFVHDQTTGETYLASIDPNGGQITSGHSGYPKISNDGRYMAFILFIYGSQRVYIRDFQNSVTTRLTYNDGIDYWPENSTVRGFSSTGQYLLLESPSPDIVPDDTNNTTDVFFVDRGNSCQ